MKSGVFKDLPRVEYDATQAANNSGLALIAKSPLHYFARYLDPEREITGDTPTLKRGRAIHAAALEPDVFAATYRKKPEPGDFPGCLATLDDYKQVCRRFGLPVSGTKDALKVRIQECDANEQFFDDICAELEAEYEMLSREDFKACAAIAASVREHPTASVLFESGSNEVTLFWVDQETGVQCKARLDRLSSDYKCVIDLKSTTDARPSEFMRSVVRYGYHRQAAWYCDAVESVTGIKPELFAFVVYESDWPHASAFYYADEQMITCGREENRRLLKIYAECLKSNHWPGYPAELQSIGLPHWYLKQAETLAETNLSEVY